MSCPPYFFRQFKEISNLETDTVNNFTLGYSFNLTAATDSYVKNKNICVVLGRFFRFNKTEQINAKFVVSAPSRQSKMML